MGLQEGFKSLADKFNKLPTWGKVTAAAGLGTGCYLLFFKNKQTGQATEPNIYYPYADNGSLDFTGVGGAEDNTSGGGGSLGGGLTVGDLNGIQDNINAWGSGIMESLGQVYNQQNEVTDVLPMGDTAKPLNTPSPDYQLYAAQLAYGNASTAAQRQAAAAAGQAARAAGATDSGANSIWKSSSGSSSGSKSSGSSSSKSTSGSSSGLAGKTSSADGKVYAKGGSGKEFVYNPSSGNIGVTKNGQTSYVKPGDKNYNSTKNAMKADTGLKF